MNDVVYHLVKRFGLILIAKMEHFITADNKIRYYNGMVLKTYGEVYWEENTFMVYDDYEVLSTGTSIEELEPLALLEIL